MKEPEDKKFQRAIIVSAILHLVLLGVFFFGFPSVFEKLPEEQDVMTFEILPTSELSNVKNENIVAKKAIEPEKSKEVKKSDTAKKQDEEYYSKKIQLEQDIKKVIALKEQLEDIENFGTNSQDFKTLLESELIFTLNDLRNYLNN